VRRAVGIPVLLACSALALAGELPKECGGFARTKTLVLTDVWGDYGGKVTRYAQGLAVSPDGRRIAVDDGGIVVFDAATGERLQAVPSESRGDCVVFTPDGKGVFATDTNTLEGSIRFLDLESGEAREFGPHDGSVVAGLAFTPDGKTLISGDSKGGLTLWDTRDRTEIKRLEPETSRLRSVALTPDGKLLVLATWRELEVRDLETGKSVRDVPIEDLSACALAPDGKHALVASKKALQLVELATGRTVRRFEGAASQLAITPDGKRAFVGGEAKLALLDLETGREVFALPTKDPVCAVAVFPDGKRALALTERLRVVDLEKGREVPFVHGHAQRVTCLAVSPNGPVLSGSDDETVKVWDRSRRREVASLSGDGPVVALDVAAVGTGTRALVAREEGAIDLLDIDGRRILGTWREQRGPLVAFVPGGRQALTGNETEKTVKLRDVATGNVVRSLVTATETGWASDVRGPQTTALAVSPDGKRALAAYALRSASLWDLESGDELVTFETREVSSLAFKPHGKMVVAVSGKFLSAWTLPSGKQAWSLEDEGGDRRMSTAMAYSPDGKRAVAGYFGARLKLWDLERGEVQDTVDLSSSGDEATAVAFSPDGRSFVAGTARGVVLRFELAK
jgi:WD40 repeat protein